MIIMANQMKIMAGTKDTVTADVGRHVDQGVDILPIKEEKEAQDRTHLQIVVGAEEEGEVNHQD